VTPEDGPAAEPSGPERAHPRFGPATPPAAAAAVRWLLAPADRLFDRLYGSRWNPLLQSGNLATLFLAVSTVSGLFLFLFYSVSAPYASVARIEEGIFLGSWVRAVHRLSAELAMVAVVFHLLRKLVQGHAYGPRFLAWTSGIFLLGALLLCGWTGLVMVWDAQALEIARQGARLVDLLPILSQPLARSFDGGEPIPSSFFFMNLFLHVALPLGVAGLLWLHVSRVARPAWLPPIPIRRVALGALALAALLVPAGLAPEADPFDLPGRVPLDLLYAFWLPVAREVPAAVHLALWLGGFVLLAAAPALWRPRARIRPSRVDPDHCTGCESCFHDCPYEAIAMVPRTAGRARSALVARVDPARCVGCGICAASCAPMGVGPGGLTGREQLAAMRDLLASPRPSGREVLVLACGNGLAARPERLASPGVRVRAAGCAGSIHTSVVEAALRGGFGGVFLLTCPTRDCLYREGPKWLAARVHDGHEAELQSRVDRRRVAIGAFSRSELAAARRAIAALATRVATFEIESADDFDLVAACPREDEPEVVGA